MPIHSPIAQVRQRARGAIGPRLRLLAVVAIMAAAAQDAIAAEFFWQSAGNAAFSDGIAWNPTLNAPPKVNDQAIFNRQASGGAGGNTVNFTTDPVNQRLLVRNDNITFNLTGRTYRLTSPDTVVPSVVVAQAISQISDLHVQGGTINAVNTTIGLVSTSDGVVDVNGTTWTNSQALTVGAGGTGELNLNASGFMGAVSTTIAEQTDSYGIVSATGAGAALSNSTFLLVGKSGYGEMHLSATATASNTYSVLGGASAATGIVTVAGDGTTWNNSSDLTVGDAGYGDLTISDSGEVTSQGAAIAREEGSQGTVTVYDHGEWTNTGNLQIGGGNATSGGIGTLVVDFQGTVDVSGTTHIWPGGLLSIRGGTFTTGTLANDGGIEYIVGVLHLTASDLTIGPTGVLGANLALSPDMHTIVDQHTTVETDGHIAVIQGSFTSHTITNNGRLSIIDGAMDFDGPSTNSAGGRITVVDGTLAVGTGNNRFVNAGRIDLIDAVVNGELRLAAGSTMSTGSAVRFNGLVSGTGTITGGGSVTFAGGFQPGDAATAVEFNGDVTFASTNALTLQIGGTVAGGQYDQISIDGAAILGGALNVSLINGFLPSAGQSFTLLDYGTRTGTFSAVNLPALSGTLAWSLDYGSTALTLSVNSLSLAGDLNHDSAINRGDLAVFIKNFGKTSGATPDQGDMNNDGKVSIADLMLLRALLTGVSSPEASPSAVPEPQAWLLTAMGAIAILAWRRKR